MSCGSENPGRHIPGAGCIQFLFDYDLDCGIVGVTYFHLKNRS